MFLLSVNKSKLAVLQKGIIASGAVNIYDVQFQFDSDWDDIERIAVFRVGTQEYSAVLDEDGRCKLPWECARENDIGREVLAGVYGMAGGAVVLPTLWASLGKIQRGASMGSAALPPTPSAAEQLLAEVMAARDEALAAARAAEEAAGSVTIPVATAETVGGVKIGPDSGLIIDADGNLSVDSASEEEAAQAINEGFGS